MNIALPNDILGFLFYLPPLAGVLMMVMESTV